MNGLKTNQFTESKTQQLVELEIFLERCQRFLNLFEYMERVSKTTVCNWKCFEEKQERTTFKKT